MEEEKVLTRLEQIFSEEEALKMDKIRTTMVSVMSLLRRNNYENDSPYLLHIKQMVNKLHYPVNVDYINIRDEEEYEEQKYLFCQLVNEVISEIKSVGLPKPKIDKMSAVINNNNNMSQTQSQSQSQNQNQMQEIAITIFLDSIKDELTGRQMREIKEIVQQEQDLNKAKPKIIDKLKSFGGDVLSNVIANIITNPIICSSF